MKKKLASGVYIIPRIKQVCGINAKVTYFALFEAHLRYRLVIWGDTSSDDQRKTVVGKQLDALQDF